MLRPNARTDGFGPATRTTERLQRQKQPQRPATTVPSNSVMRQSPETGRRHSDDERRPAPEVHRNVSPRGYSRHAVMQYNPAPPIPVGRRPAVQNGSQLLDSVYTRRATGPGLDMNLEKAGMRSPVPDERLTGVAQSERQTEQQVSGKGI